ncbi:T9SS type A sorting domain-containing protein [Rurimicrobium arvi]
MKKLLVAALLASLSALPAGAQFYYNKTYVDPATTKFTAMDHVAVQVDDASVMLSREYDLSTWTNDIRLTKFDDIGNVMFERIWRLNETGAILPDRLVRTADGGFIVVGTIMRSGRYNPFAAKFNSVGDHTTLEWAKEYTVNAGNWLNKGRNPIVSITKCAEDADSYIITCNTRPYWYDLYASRPVGDPLRFADNDASVLVMRIRGNNGSQMWCNKYEMNAASRNTGPGGTYIIMTNMPHTVANGNGKSLIAGLLDYGVYYGLGYVGFYMAVNDDGSINQQYNMLDDAWYMESPHAIYDDQGATGFEFAMTYTEANGHFPPGSPFIAKIGGLQIFSAVGTVTKSPAANFYNLGSSGVTKFVGLDKKGTAGTQYVVSLDLEGAEGSGSPTNMALLALNKTPAPGSIAGFKKFNVANNTHTQTRPITLYAAGFTLEKSVTLGWANSPLGIGVRQISADINTFSPPTCGEAPETGVELNDITTEIGFVYDVYDAMGSLDFEIYEDNFSTDMNDCRFFPPATYRTAISTSASDFCKLYPNLIGDEQKSVKLDLSVTHATQLQIQLVSMDGRIMLSKSLDLPEGAQSVDLPLPALSSGNYFVNVRSSDAKINEHFRITKM